MKRFFLFVIVLMVVSCMLARHRKLESLPATRSHVPGIDHDDHARWRTASEKRLKTRQALAEARHAVAEARNQVRQAFAEAGAELRRALDEVGVSVDSEDDSVAQARGVQGTQPADDEPQPAPILVQGRVGEAAPQPPAAPALPAPPAPAEPVAMAVLGGSDTSVVLSDLSATGKRAEADARNKLEAEVSKWLQPDVPSSWSPPQRLLDSMVRDTCIERVGKEYGEQGTVYLTKLTVDSSPRQRAAFIADYNREIVQRRMVTLGGVLAFVLTCLGAISWYIRTDEATKGYYTNRLRLLAAAGVGAAGVIIYQMVV